MPRGGARANAGREQGSKNKKTIERELLAARIQAEQAHAQGQRPNRKLAREVLDDLMHTFLGMAAQHQPLQVGQLPGPGQVPDENKFVTYATLAGQHAALLAPYQSPKFKAVIQVSENMPGSIGGPSSDPVPGLRDQVEKMTAQQAYRMLRDRDVIDVTPNEKPKPVPAKKVANG